MTATLAMPTAAEPRPKDRFRSHDGVTLPYRLWPARTAPRRTVVLLHRGHEHSGRWEEVVRSLALDDADLFAWDARVGPASVATLVKDLDCFMKHLAAGHGTALEETVVVAHSVSAVIATAWVHDHAPRIRGLALVTPAFRVKLYLPFAVASLRLLHKLRPHAHVKSYVRPHMLTRDPAQAEAYAADPLITRDISVRTLLDLHDTGARLVADAATIRTPTLVLTAGSDAVVRVAPQRRFFERLGATEKSMEVFPGFRHALLHDRDREQPIARLREFVREGAAVTSPRTDPRPRFFPARLFLKTVGRLSEGIRIGWKHGFDSGPSLDHVYRNRGRGITPLGRLLDRVYLDAPGWRGIRQRRDLLETTLRRAIAHRRETGRPVRLMDVASGPGRYVLETLAGLPRRDDVTALLRDRDPAGLEAARRLARDLELDGHVTIERGDAFDRDGLARVRPRPGVVIVSGLYELFGDNGPIEASLSGIAEAIEPGGLLIYTNQPWHPQLAFIANVLTNRDGEPWVMRCRPQAEIDELVERAGFRKLDTLVEDQGIFTVSLAQRR